MAVRRGMLQRSQYLSSRLPIAALPDGRRTSKNGRPCIQAECPRKVGLSPSALQVRRRKAVGGVALPESGRSSTRTFDPKRTAEFLGNGRSLLVLSGRLIRSSQRTISTPSRHKSHAATATATAAAGPVRRDIPTSSEVITSRTRWVPAVPLTNLIG